MNSTADKNGLTSPLFQPSIRGQPPIWRTLATFGTGARDVTSETVQPNNASSGHSWV